MPHAEWSDVRFPPHGFRRNVKPETSFSSPAESCRVADGYGFGAVAQTKHRKENNTNFLISRFA
jgi:hypothetical protein